MPKRRRKTIFDLFNEWFNEIFEDLFDFEREIERFLREAPEGRVEVKGPYVYGFRIFIGPDGKPRIEEFGNVRRVRGRPQITEEREPLVDVLEEKDHVIVIAEMPGVEKNKIKVRATERRLIIEGSNTNRRYYKEVELPTDVKPDTAKAAYRNGVLEVRIEKRKKEGKGIEIKVE
ncbi:MAG: heat-shock protein Hsp20 [Desulfurococcales archaeon ex4484_42]|nr:MAG: heat-shock protein Hsp20 [Desulfurococcales archaeon ex4484_42]